MSLEMKTGSAEDLSGPQILIGTAKSGFITADDFHGFNALQISAPATLTNTVSLELLKAAGLDETQAGNWNTLQSPSGTDVTIPAGKTLVISIAGFIALRLSSAGNEAATRQFYIAGIRNRPSG